MTERIYIQLGQVMLKADEHDESIIYLEASNEENDLQGDTVLQKALKEQAESFVKSGVISFDHQHKIKNDPNYIIGEPMDVRFPEKRTLVKARLYPTNEYAKGILAMAKSGSTRLGASVGGWVKERIKKVDELTKATKNYITSVVWDETAITYKPVNSGTMGGVTLMTPVEFAKSFAFPGSDLHKALMAGAGTDAATMTGGRALVPESLQGADRKKREQALVDVMKLVDEGKILKHEELDAALKERGINSSEIKKRIMQRAIQRRGKK